MRAKSKSKTGPPAFPKTDRRLLGTWRSDARMTLADWNWSVNTPPGTKARIKALFGKLRTTFTRTRVCSTLPHSRFEFSRRYSVLAMDETSVAIAEFGELHIRNEKDGWREGIQLIKAYGSGLEIKHIHFDGDHFWIPIGNGKNREFFRKEKGLK